MKRVLIAVIILFCLSLLLNGLLFVNMQDQLKFVTFDDANSRDTYFTVHNVREAQEYSSGKGIKVGILDHYFGFSDHSDLYAGGYDFLSDDTKFNEIAEHGLWMAITLKEIAPDVEVYALNVASRDEDQRAEAVVAALEWAIANDLDILTHSHAPFSGNNRKKTDQAVEKAIAAGIVTTFIHYPHPQNLFPFGMYDPGSSYEREPDVNILHHDYNTLVLRFYRQFLAGQWSMSPYHSLSSTSPVTAGFVALLKEIDPSLESSQYKKILVETSKEVLFKDHYLGSEYLCPRVVDAGTAVRYLVESRSE